MRPRSDELGLNLIRLHISYIRELPHIVNLINTVSLNGTFPNALVFAIQFYHYFHAFSISFSVDLQDVISNDLSEKIIRS